MRNFAVKLPFERLGLVLSKLMGRFVMTWTQSLCEELKLCVVRLPLVCVQAGTALFSCVVLRQIKRFLC